MSEERQAAVRERLEIGTRSQGRERETANLNAYFMKMREGENG